MAQPRHNEKKPRFNPANLEKMQQPKFNPAERGTDESGKTELTNPVGPVRPSLGEKTKQNKTKMV